MEFECCGERRLAPETSAINDEQYAAAPSGNRHAESAAHTPHPNPLPARGERVRNSKWTVNPGFRLCSTLGYKYFVPSGAWTKRSAILTPGLCGNLFVTFIRGRRFACPGATFSHPSPHPLPARGERRGLRDATREPRVPLALHPGLQIFRPYRGLDKTLCYSDFWLLTSCRQPCDASGVRSVWGYQGRQPLINQLCGRERDFCSRFWAHACLTLVSRDSSQPTSP